MPPNLMLLVATSGRDFGQVSESAMGQALRLGSERWMVRLVGNQQAWQMLRDMEREIW